MNGVIAYLINGALTSAFLIALQDPETVLGKLGIILVTYLVTAIAFVTGDKK